LTISGRFAKNAGIRQEKLPQQAICSVQGALQIAKMFSRFADLPSVMLCKK
jgi:hypothetical protein